jgi:hypothetical protein
MRRSCVFWFFGVFFFLILIPSAIAPIFLLPINIPASFSHRPLATLTKIQGRVFLHASFVDGHGNISILDSVAGGAVSLSRRVVSSWGACLPACLLVCPTDPVCAVDN